MRKKWLILGISAVVALVAAVVLPSRVHRSRVLAQLNDPSPAVRLAAVRALDPKSDVELLVAALKDEDADVRLVTAWQLGGEGLGGEERVAALIAALKDRHSGVRRAAEESLWSLGPASGPALIAVLKDPDPRVRAGALRALSTQYYKTKRKRAPGELEAIKPLLKDLQTDEDLEVRKIAANAWRWES